MLSDRVRGGNWGGLYGVGRLISDRMSYRNHYMCSGQATSTYINSKAFEFCKTFKLRNRG